MIYAAIVKGRGATAGTWNVAPQYTRIDGADAPEIEAFAVNGLMPAAGDMVICAEGINDFLQSMQMIFNDTGGAFPLIIATLAQLIVLSAAVQITGNVKLGQGGKKMLLGETVQTWAQGVDAALQALYAWGASVSPAFPGAPPLQTWPAAALSTRHELD